MQFQRLASSTIGAMGGLGAVILVISCSTPALGINLKTQWQLGNAPVEAHENSSFLAKLATECQCHFSDVCSCDGAITFMECVADSCESGNCECQGHGAFQSTCGEMASKCPGIGLQCTRDGGSTSKAACSSSAGPRESVMHWTKPQAVKAPAPAAPTMPKVEAPALFPVPTTARCIVIICCQYMLIMTALALCRTYHEVTGTVSGKAEGALRAAAQTVTYGPMLCVLFIACRMRVEFLSDGKDQPQMWVQNCMYATTFAVLATTLLVLIIPLAMGKPLALKEGTCELEKPAGGGNIVLALSAVRYLIQLGLYGGIAGVIVGINRYTPPGQNDVYKMDNVPKPAPAVMCTMILAVTFFLTQLIVAGARSFTEFTGVVTERIVNVMNTAADTVSFAPMLAILYLAARMRALQHDGQPQAWAQNCMYASTVALVVTTALAVAIPLILGGETQTDAKTGQSTFKVSNPGLGKAFVAVRYLTIVAMYGGAVGVIYSIFVFEAPKGPEHTLPVSPTVQCVVNLCVQYFFIFLLLNIMNTVKEFQLRGAGAEPTLQITIVQATGLKHLNLIGDNMKCSCVVQHAGMVEVPSKCTTKGKKMLEPVWNETFELAWEAGEAIEFKVHDEGMLTSKTEGVVLVPSEHFYPNGFAGDLPISGLSAAKLHVTILPTAEESVLSRVFKALDAARATVTFAPMLSILFVTTRMYALLLTDKKGSPQAWVQDGMFMATWSLLLSFVLCLATAALAGEVQLDEDGNVVNKFKNRYVAIGINITRYLAMLLLYGGIITVIVGLFVMTPETANGRGSIPFVSDAVSQTPAGMPPPGLNSVTLPPSL